MSADFEESGVRRVADGVHDHVVALPVLREVLRRVVDDVVSPETAHRLDVGAAAHRRHLGTAMLGELDGDGADSAGRAVDQD